VGGRTFEGGVLARHYGTKNLVLFHTKFPLWLQGMKLKLKLFLRYKQIFIDSYCMLCLNDGQVLKYCAIMDTPHHTTWPYQTWLTTAFMEWNALLTILALGYDRLVQCHFKHKRTCSCHFPPEWTTKVYETVVRSSLLQGQYPQKPINLRNPPGKIPITTLPIVYRAYTSINQIDHIDQNCKEESVENNPQKTLSTFPLNGSVFIRAPQWRPKHSVKTSLFCFIRYCCCIFTVLINKINVFVLKCTNTNCV